MRLVYCWPIGTLTEPIAPVDASSRTTPRLPDTSPATTFRRKVYPFVGEARSRSSVKRRWMVSSDPSSIQRASAACRIRFFSPRMVRKLDLLERAWFMTSSSRFAIMGNRDADSPGSIPVRCDRGGRLDKPTPTAGHRLPSGREPRFARAGQRPASTIQRRPAPSIGFQGQWLRSEASERGGHAGDARDFVGLAPEANRQQI